MVYTKNQLRRITKLYSREIDYLNKELKRVDKEKRKALYVESITFGIVCGFVAGLVAWFIKSYHV
jgi:hypothetical protein